MTDIQSDDKIWEIPFAIPADWTQDQARAVAELLQDLSMLIMSFYQLYDDDVWDGPGDSDDAPLADLPEAPPFDDELPF